MYISIIIPTLNEEEHISTLLKCLENHSDKDHFEVIVVDGGSDDQTLSVVSNYEVKLLSSKSCSRACQMNLGAREAQGQVLYFIHADTIPVERFVSDIKKAVDTGYQSGCYRFKFQNPPNILLHINGFFTRFPFKWCRGGDQTFFITKEVFDNLKGFNEDYVIMEDYELMDRLDVEKVPFTIIPKSVKVSARKYLKNPYFKVQLANFKAMKMYRRGVAPAQIKKYYTHVLN